MQVWVIFAKKDPFSVTEALEKKRSLKCGHVLFVSLLGNSEFLEEEAEEED